MTWPTLRDNLTRKKTPEAWLSDTPLIRCLTAMDLTSLGVGTVVGAGLYVVIGDIARDFAGPAVVLSVLLASFSALLCALSYTEYACRFPEAGSAYYYTYATLGEIWAFISGWNIVLEYILSGASLASQCSSLVDDVFHGKVHRFFADNIATWNFPGQISRFPDLLACSVVLITMAIVCLGARSSTNVHNAVTVLNLLVVLFIITFGMFFADFKNWTNDFVPHGVHGILRGAATIFFAFSGLDIVAEATEETINPRKHIPLSLLIILTVSTFCFFGVAAVLTLIVPYKELSDFAPLVEAFGARKAFPAAKYIIACGGICAIISALFCAVFATSRVVYCMATDGLLFGWFSNVHDKTHVPVRATVISGTIMASLALMFDLGALVTIFFILMSGMIAFVLVELSAIGTLMAYTGLTISVLVSRYQVGVKSVPYEEYDGETTCCHRIFRSKSLKSKTNATNDSSHVAYQQITDELESSNDSKSEATERTSHLVNQAVFTLVCGMVGLAVLLTRFFQHLSNGEWWAISLSCLFGGVIVISLVSILQQPRNSATFPFMVPCVPYIPVLSIFINVVLLVNLNKRAYIRFGVWMVIGFSIYIFHGYRHSREALQPIKQQTQGDEYSIQDVQETPDIQPDVTTLQPIKQQTQGDEYSIQDVQETPDIQPDVTTLQLIKHQQQGDESLIQDVQETPDIQPDVTTLQPIKHQQQGDESLIQDVQETPDIQPDVTTLQPIKHQQQGDESLIQDVQETPDIQPDVTTLQPIKHKQQGNEPLIQDNQETPDIQPDVTTPQLP